MSLLNKLQLCWLIKALCTRVHLLYVIVILVHNLVARACDSYGLRLESRALGRRCAIDPNSGSLVAGPLTIRGTRGL